MSEMKQSTVDLAMMTTISNLGDKNAKLDKINQELLEALEAIFDLYTNVQPGKENIAIFEAAQTTALIANKAIFKAKGEPHA